MQHPTLGDFKGQAVPLTSADISKAAHGIGVGEDEIHAFLDVETNGSGYDKYGRPKMLYEPHVVYRNAASPETRDDLVRRGLAYKSWGENAYPRDSYPRLYDAMFLDQNAALVGCSWGIGQILGENSASLKYPSISQMILSFMDSEEAQLDGVIRFLKVNNLVVHLQNHDWWALAEGYNGPRHAEHDYAGRLERRFEWWQKVPDTPWTPELSAQEERQHHNERYPGFQMPTTSLSPEAGAYVPVPASKPKAYVPPAAAPTPARKPSGGAEPVYRTGVVYAELQTIQRLLQEQDYHEVGTVDGLWGSRTRGAVLAFKADNDLPLTAAVDNAFRSALLAGRSREVDEVRKNTTANQLAAAGSRTVKTAKETEWLGMVTVGGGGLAGLKSLIGDAQQYQGLLRQFLDTIDPLVSTLQENWGVILLAVGAYVIWRSKKVISDRLDDHRSGRNVGR